MKAILKAISNLGMGFADLVYLSFPECFWPDETQIFLVPNFDGFSIFFNFGKFQGQPLLLGYLGGKTAQSLALKSENELLRDIMLGFQNIFHRNIPNPRRYFFSHWVHDPFSYGSYSYLPAGASVLDREILLEPELDRIFFAGEATSPLSPATTHGAYLSGLQQAERMIATL